MMIVFIFAVLGLFVGSFLNVLVLRLRDGEDFVTGRSRCPSCRSLIAWYDNVPLLSYLFLRGKCRKCEKMISLQYPIVEALTGVVFGATAYLFVGVDSWGGYVSLLLLLLTFSLLIAIAVYDALTMEIEMRLFFVVLAATIGYLIWQAIFEPGRGVGPLVGSITAGVVAAFLLGSIVWYSKEQWMGWGDVWLVFPIAMLAGPTGVLPMLTLSFGSGAVVGLVLLAQKRKGLKSQIPLGPFLVFGGITWFLLEMSCTLSEYFLGGLFL